jgi:7,8-dihydropterin-6-yl-methyl-4-(beta-D-ribofuranosyl)aminobenzene 5'-phosphate synthase
MSVRPTFLSAALLLGAFSLNAQSARFLAATLARDRGPVPRHAPATNQPMVDDYRITVLSDMTPGRRTIGEWGFSALIEITAGGVSKRFLFDTGGNPQTVLNNARTLNIPICDIQDVVITHNHDDHTSGLETLRNSCKDANPNAFKTAYIGGEEMFWPRINAAGVNANIMIAARSSYTAGGGAFVLNTQPTAQFLGLPGVWLTGKIGRKYDEKTYLVPQSIQDPSGKLGLDLIPEEMALVINTSTGMVVVTGCAHAGITNTILTAQSILGAQPPVTIVGGVHFFPLPLGEENTDGEEGTILWEANQMRRLGVVSILGAHCTGQERFLFLRNFLGLDESAATFSSIGTSLSMNDGFLYPIPFTINTPLRPGWETQLQTLACGTAPPTPSCQANVSAWNYYLVNKVSPAARPLIVGNGTQLMTVQQYLAARAASPGQ